MRTGTPRTVCIICADEKGIDLRLSRKDDLSATAKEHCSISLGSDRANDMRLFLVESVIRGHRIKLSCADRPEACLGHLIGTAQDILKPIAGAKTLCRHGNHRAVIALNSHLLRNESGDLTAAAAVLATNGNNSILLHVHYLLILYMSYYNDFLSNTQ